MTDKIFGVIFAVLGFLATLLVLTIGWNIVIHLGPSIVEFVSEHTYLSTTALLYLSSVALVTIAYRK